MKLLVYATCLALLAWRGAEWQARQKSLADFCQNSGRMVWVRTRIEEKRGAMAWATRLEWAHSSGRVSALEGRFRFLDPPNGGLTPGQRLEIGGMLHCQSPFRNPSAKEDRWWKLTRWDPVIAARQLDPLTEGNSSIWNSRGWRETLLARLTPPASKFPALSALVFAIWTGSVDRFPRFLADFYQEAGLLQILALSGQHVAAFLFVVMGVVPRGLLLRICGTGPYRYLMAGLPLGAAGILYFTSSGSHPLQRALVMFGFHWLLRVRGFYCSALQLVLSTFVLQILWRPDCFFSLGFMLSVVSTAFLCTFTGVGASREGVKSYLWLSVWMPIVLFPLGAFYFGKVPLLAPVLGIALNVTWDAIWIPLGFFLSILYFFVPGFVYLLAPPIEKMFAYFILSHEKWLPWILSSYVSTLRPTIGELLGFECIVLGWGLFLLSFRRNPERI